MVLTGCSTDKETLLPHGEQTMLDIWNGAGSQGTQQQLLDARQQLRRPLAQADFSVALQEPYTRTAANEIRNLFPRLPNPDLVLYVYPHLSGTEQAPVPGYSTVFFRFTNGCSTHYRVNVRKTCSAYRRLGQGLFCMESLAPPIAPSYHLGR
nr:hypothetical protein GCM10020185_00960 [Pseudomonas brassicacearum subsp. brassicacearum]